MSYYEIEGGAALTGTVQLSGAKNLASKLILASLLTNEPCTLTNLPTIGEIDVACQLLEAAGATITRNADTAVIEAATVHHQHLHTLPAKTRLSILLIGPLLYRTGRASVPPVTGDQIGKRPVGFHIDALRSLGVTIEQTPNGFEANADAITGATIQLPYPSVGATETILLTASWATGATTITNAAIEPEIIELCAYLNALGANIVVEQDIRCIHIQGVSSFHGAKHRVISDRLEAVSYASVALATGGSILLQDARAQDLTTYLAFVERVGGQVIHHPTGIEVRYCQPLRPTAIETAVHPGFMADWQQPSVVVLCRATGVSYVHETVYEDRLRYTDDLVRMGATIEVSSECYGTPCRFAGQGHRHSASITGPTQFRHGTLHIPDIRAGMAHVIAALVAPGMSRLYGIDHLDRGYGPSLETKLRGLGATIKRVED